MAAKTHLFYIYLFISINCKSMLSKLIGMICYMLCVLNIGIIQ